MIANNAFISINEVVSSYRIINNKPIHYHYSYLKLAADAVRELSLSYMPMVQHTILTKADNESWFTLPSGYSDYVSVGILVGDRWRPIAVSGNIIPFPNSAGGGEYGSEFSNGFNVNGAWTNWVNPDFATTAPSFNPNDFNNDFQNTTITASGIDDTADYSFCIPTRFSPYTSHFNDYGESIGRFFGGVGGYRNDVVAFNPTKNIIMCPSGFPSNHLYLVYTGVGTVDTMTHIPLQAQAAIEAKIDWKYAASKLKPSRGDLRDLERLYYIQEQIMINRFMEFGLTELHRIISKNFKRAKA